MQKNQFSQKLIDETVKCFKEENGIIVSEKQAVEILNNFAGLFLSYSRGVGGCLGKPLGFAKTDPTLDSIISTLKEKK